MAAHRFRLLGALAVYLSLCLPVASQSLPDGACEDILDQAATRYLAQDYADVESLATDCVHLPNASSVEVQEAYRLLALAFIKQDLIFEAQTTIIKLLGVNFDYEPDRVQDPPVYVAIVTAVKDQLTAAPQPLAGFEAAGGAVVNINSASAEVLESLSGIGPVLASRIVDYRNTYGHFRSVEELQEVRGIGPRTMERLLPFITIHEAVASYAAPGGAPLDTLQARLPVPPPEPAAPTLPRHAQINVNTASAAELQTLDGIGPVLAARIVEHRSNYGPYDHLVDLLEVQGIGPHTLERLAPFVIVESDD